ncbi:MAG: LysE family transporter [Pelolinea sp.]|nr:LysE family transporter [Pelolinea sp.]
MADLILSVFPAYGSIMRAIGAAYILWLAYRTLKTTYAAENGGGSPMGFKDGFIFQFLNPKVILFSLTLYASYLQPVTRNFLPLFITAAVLAARAFIINSAWALFGAAIRRFLSRPLIGKAFNIVIAALLVYNAADLLGLPDLLINGIR